MSPRHLDPPRSTGGLGWGVGLVVLTFLFRVPAFLNFAALDSDVAVVGLQSWHLGEQPSPLLLWGTNYQGVTAPVMARLVEWVLPLRSSLAVSSVVGHVLGVLALFGALRRRLPSSAAALAAGCVVVCAEPFNYLTYSAFRIWSFTLIFIGLYFAERAADAESRPRRLRLALLAGVSVGLGYYTDLFVMQLLPGVAVYLLWWTWDQRAPRRLSLGAALLGFVLGSIPRWVAHMSPPTLSELSLANLKHNWPLFWEKCLPYVMGAKLFPMDIHFDRTEQVPQGVWLVLAGAGLSVFVVLGVVGGLLSLWPGREPGPRRLAWCGAAWVGVSLVGFLFTQRPQDVMSARYLVPILLGFPLLVAPVLHALPRERETRWALGLLLPVLLHFGAAGWRGYGGWLDAQGLPRTIPEGSGEYSDALLAALQQRGVDAGVADYWVAYRLTYLWREKLTLAPYSGSERRAEYQQRRASARRLAVVISAPDEGALASWEQTFQREGRRYERLTLSRYNVLLPE